MDKFQFIEQYNNPRQTYVKSVGVNYLFIAYQIEQVDYIYPIRTSPFWDCEFLY